MERALGGYDKTVVVRGWMLTFVNDERIATRTAPHLVPFPTISAVPYFIEAANAFALVALTSAVWSSPGPVAIIHGMRTLPLKLDLIASNINYCGAKEG